MIVDFTILRTIYKRYLIGKYLYFLSMYCFLLNLVTVITVTLKFASIPYPRFQLPWITDLIS